MDPSPPSGAKPRAKYGRRHSSKDLPFYEAPADKITPAQIVSEAKHELLVSDILSTAIGYPTCYYATKFCGFMIRMCQIIINFSSVDSVTASLLLLTAVLMLKTSIVTASVTANV